MSINWVLCLLVETDEEWKTNFIIDFDFVTVAQE